jgi:hypothetical protein
LGKLAKRAGPAGIDAGGINQILSPRPVIRKNGRSHLLGERLFFVDWAGFGTESRFTPRSAQRDDRFNLHSSFSR